ncbi:MAG: hypothetical protein GF408_06110 [Candidatus Omnitrophica bacterium]|nr:hypothetical protein [Candidatus Omnitrophota bacterium]
MKVLLTVVLMLLALTAPARADYTLIVPQEPGGGTSIWATVVASELEKKLGERVIIRHIPGARDQIGFDKFHNRLRFDEKTIMVSHGGNAVSFLQEKVDYNYADYSPVAIMNNNIIVSRREDLDWREEKIIFPERSGTVPESMALALLVGGPDAWDNWSQRVVYVKRMDTPECRMAFRRGEINVTRENPAAHKKHVEPVPGAVPFFHHGLFDPESGKFDRDPNFPEVPTLEELYSETWGAYPEGRLYEAYKMVKAWRDGVQKALWVNRGNPDLERLRSAVRAMLDDPEAMERIHAKLGSYPWHVGGEAENYMNALYPLITEEAMETLVEFNRDALNLDSFYNEKLIYRKDE